jgi:acetyl-CoA acetyltransferase
VLSQKRYAAALEAGRCAEELVPVEVPGRKGPQTLARDEHPRPDTSVESLRKLPKVFKKDGVIHAGAASGICDGAGALVVASAQYAQPTAVNEDTATFIDDSAHWRAGRDLRGKQRPLTRDIIGRRKNFDWICGLGNPLLNQRPARIIAVD